MDHIESLLDRPRIYNNIDGVAELSAGIFFSGLVLIEKMPANLRIISFALLAAAIHFAGRAIKARITWPRTGYAECRREGQRRIVVLTAVISALAVIVLYVARQSRWDSRMTFAITGLLFTIAYARGVAGTIAWKWVPVAMIAATAVATNFLDPDSVPQIPVLAVAAVLFVSGAITLAQYLHSHPAPAGDEE